MIFGTGVAILTSVFPPGRRGQVLGINVAAVYLGLSLGPFAGGYLTNELGWRSVFVVNAAVGLVVTLVVLLKLRGEWAGARGERFDLGGSVLYGATVTTMMLGLTRIPSASGGWLVLAGVAGLAALLWWERRVDYAVLNTSLFRGNRVFAFSNLAALVNYSSTSAVGFLMSLYLQYVKGLSSVQAGLVLIAQPAVMCLLSPFAGRLSDRIESRTVASIGMGVTVVALVAFATLDAASGVPRVVAALAVLGFGLGLFSSPNTNAIMGSVERRSYGVASATLGTARLVGQMLSMGVAMLVLSVVVGRVQIEPSCYPQFIAASRSIFGIFAALSFAGIFASLARGKVRG
jgi:MFS family permease